MGRVGAPAAGREVKTPTAELMRYAALLGGAALALTLFVAWWGAPVPGDERVIREFQGIDLLDRNEGWINQLGRLQWQLPVVAGAIILAGVGPSLGLKAGAQQARTEAIWVLATTSVLRFLTTPLKQAAQSPRPGDGIDIHIGGDFPGYGFPSGHVYSDVLIYGAIAFVAPAVIGRAGGAAVRVFCIALIILAGPARMAVGAHWPSDVLGGYLWGGAALCIALVAGRRLSGRA